MDTTTLTIDGMHCGSCVARVARTLAALPGVQVMDVEVGLARVHVDPRRSSQDAVVRALNDSGFSARTDSGTAQPQGGACCGQC